ncbi:MAG: hypothetical protein ACLTSL_09420 [Odoribacter splanchnicus]
MKKYFLLSLVFLFGILLSCSENDSVIRTNSSDKFTSKREFKNYNEDHKSLFKEICSLQQNIDVKDKDEMVNLFKLYQNDPEQYESLLKEKLVLLIGEANFNKLEKLVEKL